ncbi:MAG: hypothetical protein IJI68_01615 [Eggerthellaceae bacterium]|nr:hypothetical protein [Eggerthellaceae bacterium]
MTDIVKQHLPTIVVVTIVGIATSYFLLSRVLANVANMDVDGFSTAVFGIPCVVMFICSTIIVLTAPGINRQLYLVVVIICMVLGVISMLCSNAWMLDKTITAALLANSPDDTTVVPVLKNGMLILRDVAAYFVIPTVGSILGAWVGSRIHPMTSESKNAKGKKSKKNK